MTKIRRSPGTDSFMVAAVPFLRS